MNDEDFDEVSGEGGSLENDGELVSVSPSNRRIKEESPPDRLSVLPDSLLIHILSFLGGVKKAAITSLLSKRWQYLWTEIPVLEFNEYHTDIEEARKFVSRISRILFLRTGNYVEEFDVHFTYHNSFASDVNTWVDYAVRNKMKRLSLQLHLLSSYTLPPVMYSRSSLTRLWLGNCIVEPRRIVDWKYLTDLCIHNVELHEHAIQRVLSGCPVLHSLDTYECWGFERLDIGNQSLHHLTVGDREDEFTGSLVEISAPYLRDLLIYFFPIGRKRLRLTNTPALNSVYILFDIFGADSLSEEETSVTMGFFEDIKHAKEIILDSQGIEIISMLAENGWQLPQSKRNWLGVTASRNENSISGIVVLLESSPNLEMLSITYLGSEEPDKIWGPVARDDLTCDLMHLKKVTLYDGADTTFMGEGEPTLIIAQILLKRATALEEMQVCVGGRLNVSSPIFLKVLKELLSYPRSSQKATVFLS